MSGAALSIETKLRWNIAYNVETGSNILLKYMTRYAIKKGEHKKHGGIDNLARSAYSTYNGGPRQVARYRNSKAGAWSRKVDKAFHGKYLQVKQGNELAVAECLGGSRAAITNLQPQQKKVIARKKPAPTINKPDAKKIIHNKTWIKQQNKNHFTLQLAAFSSQKAATDFISRQSVTGNYAIYLQNTKPTKQLYTVIYGYYSTRERAEKGSKAFKAIKTWIRPFKDIQASINYHAYKTWFEFDLEGRPQQNPSGALLK